MTSTTTISAANTTHIDAARRTSSETKPSFKTTEFYVYVASVIGVLVASLLVGEEGPSGDVFQADRAWMLVTALTIGYMLSRGLAKSGSREINADHYR